MEMSVKKRGNIKDNEDGKCYDNAPISTVS